ncbi:D-inositol-3-phosphate glycosyltransferase [Conyzicola lurida]|uniref:D-inositol 3-phosphate glycosyltransferase n=2 Tax=Conyzicola lurida TaxID=1172621 RepID=A0A841AMG2_9MICO|nr:D-inositol-3-phosphate glycosyltransferase [Conyzicola lurida]
MHTSPAATPGQADAGGMNVAILGLARELAGRGIAVDLLTRSSGQSTVTDIAPGITLHELEAGPPGIVAKEDLSSVADEFGEAVARLAGRESGRYDVIHAHYWISGIAALPVAIELGIPFVQSFHTLGDMKHRAMIDEVPTEPQRRVRSESFLANQADAVIASSTAEVDALLEQVGAPAEHVWIMPPGVDTGLFAPRPEAGAAVREALGIEADRPVIAVVGRVQELKGQRLAVRVLAALPEPRPVLVIAGRPTPGAESYFLALHELAAELGVVDDLRFTGALEREAVAELFAAATLTLVPSHSETFGLVALESAASGTPVVAQRVSGLVESVSDGESGLLIDSRDPADWARAIGVLLDNPAAYAELARSARAFAEGFSWETSVSVLLDVYESVAARPVL